MDERITAMNRIAKTYFDLHSLLLDELELSDLAKGVSSNEKKFFLTIGKNIFLTKQVAREVFYNAERKKWEVHDYVETVVKGEVHTLVFHSLENVLDSYAVFDGPFERIPVVKSNAKKYKTLHFRGADSQQIGGVSHWKQFEQFTSRLRENPAKELEKNKRRVQLMIKEGIIPKEVDYQIQN